MVEAAQTAANTHPTGKLSWLAWNPLLGRNKAIVAIARKLLVAVWHILARGERDHYADPNAHRARSCRSPTSRQSPPPARPIRP